MGKEPEDNLENKKEASTAVYLLQPSTSNIMCVTLLLAALCSISIMLTPGIAICLLAAIWKTLSQPKRLLSTGPYKVSR